MNRYLIFVLLLLCASSSYSQPEKITVVTTDQGQKLQVNGKDFFINGMNWDYFPIGTNYSYAIWQQPDEVIEAALDYEMPLLRDMGVNAIRQYTGVPPKYIEYIYENYGIYTVLNHSFGRYGLTLNGEWVPQTDYSNPAVMQLLLKESKEMATEYKNTPGLLMFLLGNENNYGLFWSGAETEDMPVKDSQSIMAAKHLYELFNKAAIEMKSIDPSHPVAICNGDLLFLEVIAGACKDVDILGINIYRGISFGDAFERVKNEYGKPVMLTELGADAFNALTQKEDQESQAHYLVGNWKEIYANAAGMGKSGNCIGGFTFQFSDSWWKYGQTIHLEEHDADASWANGGYLNDYEKGKNNMNEEWFGICAKGKSGANNKYELYPRQAYYALKEVHKLNPYGANAKSEILKLDQIHVTMPLSQPAGEKLPMESDPKE